MADVRAVIGTCPDCGEPLEGETYCPACGYGVDYEPFIAAGPPETEIGTWRASMADPLIPPQQAEAALPRMEAAGLGWLTPILRRMIDGDPWQEGQFAVEIAEAWNAADPESCVQCGAPGVAHHEPPDRPSFWLCLDCDD